MDLAAEKAHVAHLHRAAPWGVRTAIDMEATGSPFRATTDGPVYHAMGLDPREISAMARTEALFLQRYAAAAT